MAFCRFVSRNSSFLRVHFFSQHYYKKPFYKGMVLNDAIEVKMPSLSPTMNQGTIVKWHKKEGDTINPGDLLCEIQTDKAVVGFEVEEEGVLAKILKGDNSKDIAVGTLIAMIAEQGTDWKTIQIPVSSQDTSSVISPTQPSQKSAFISADRHSHHSNMLGPVVRNLIGQYGIDPEQVPHTGPHDVLLKSDLLKYIQEKHLKPVEKKSSPPTIISPQKLPIGQQSLQADTLKKAPRSHAYTQFSDYVDVPLSEARNLHAKQSHFSKNTIPHSYLTSNCILTAVYSLCEEFKKEMSLVTWIDIFIKATAVSLERYPIMNALWVNDSLHMLKDINISFVLDNGGVPMKPIIKNTASLTVFEISKQIADFKMKFQSDVVDSTAFQGPSFVVSYLEDSCGLTGYTSLIQHPHVACLSVASPYSCLDENNKNQNYVSVTLSVNNQVIDDVTGSGFLECLKDALENPSLLISHFPVKVDLAKLFAK